MMYSSKKCMSDNLDFMSRLNKFLSATTRVGALRMESVLQCFVSVLREVELFDGFDNFDSLNASRISTLIIFSTLDFYQQSISLAIEYNNYKPQD